MKYGIIGFKLFYEFSYFNTIKLVKIVFLMFQFIDININLNYI